MMRSLILALALSGVHSRECGCADELARCRSALGVSRSCLADAALCRAACRGDEERAPACAIVPERVPFYVGDAPPAVALRGARCDGTLRFADRALRVTAGRVALEGLRVGTHQLELVDGDGAVLARAPVTLARAPDDSATTVPTVLVDGRAVRRGGPNASLPTIPFGFYQYTIDERNDANLATVEAVSGMNLACPYVSAYNRSAAGFEAVRDYLDRAWATGFVVHYQLIAYENEPNNATNDALLAAEIDAFKDHPALFAWYIADEPDGQGIDASELEHKYALIKARDPHHPISMVFCAGGAADYLAALDLVMVDPYPVPSDEPARDVAGAIDAVVALGKPVVVVPQAFGGGENWARAPSAAEERAMTYAALLHGARAGVQYFVRAAPVMFPYAAAAWSEIRQIAAEVLALTPALASSAAAPAVRVADLDDAGGASAVEALALVDRDGSWLVLALNTRNGGAPARFNLTLDDGGASGALLLGNVTAVFEGGRVVPSDGASVFDTLRGYGTAVYRIETVASRRAAAAAGALAPSVALNYNPSFEIAVNPSVPDGHYIGAAPSDDASTFFADARVATSGRNSLRLAAPSADGGLSLSPYTLPTTTAGAAYTLSFALRGAVGGEAFELTVGNGLRPAGARSFVARAGEWETHSIQLTGTGGDDCPYGCRGWLSYRLACNGTIWLDDLAIVAA